MTNTIQFSAKNISPVIPRTRFSCKTNFIADGTLVLMNEYSPLNTKISTNFSCSVSISVLNLACSASYAFLSGFPPANVVNESDRSFDVTGVAVLLVEAAPDLTFPFVGTFELAAGMTVKWYDWLIRGVVCQVNKKKSEWPWEYLNHLIVLRARCQRKEVLAFPFVSFWIGSKHPGGSMWYVGFVFKSIRNRES